jgi:dipeptidyl aminopeptidase/acylaminoacyl peptidase
MHRLRVRQLAIPLGLALAAASAIVRATDAPKAPTVDDLLNLRTIGAAEISPDGRSVAYSVSEADFEHDAFVRQLWIARPSSGAPFQLTRGSKSASDFRWSPDGRWIGFLSDRVGDKTQIFVIRPDGGEAVQLTKAENGIEAFDWSRDSTQIAFTASEPETADQKARKDRLGDFTIVRREYSFVHLHTLNVAEALKAPVEGKAHTSGHDFSVGDFDWSPDGSSLAFAATLNPDLIQGGTSDIYVVDLKTDKARKIVSQPGPDVTPKWSPDGTQIAFQSAMGRLDFFHSNPRIAVVASSGGPVTSLSDAFDEEPSLIAWKGDTIWFEGLQKTAGHLFSLNPKTRAIARVSRPDGLIGYGFSLSSDASHVGFAAASPTTMTEVYLASTDFGSVGKLTDMTAQLAPFTVGSREVISWKSKDGTTIEGVLVKPKDFSPEKRYPLLVVTHGGPTGVDRPYLVENRYYPVDVWVDRGALVLKVNYRGSAGYGERFRELNVKNLGVGDSWDITSGIESLVAKGWVDPSRVGCMGWSQGGYISAFLTTSTTVCAAVSVGAGISDWTTYYYNTDITPFTLQYLGANPVDDPEIYAKTSPITYIKQAKTPTLIQHGENDRRVPIPNGYELRQALEDRHVPVEMVVYKGFGHGISKPKAMRAVMNHNLAWFNHYVFGDKELVLDK